MNTDSTLRFATYRSMMNHPQAERNTHLRCLQLFRSECNTPKHGSSERNTKMPLALAFFQLLLCF